MSNVGTLPDKKCIRGDVFVESLRFYSDEGMSNPLNLEDFDDIVMDFRTGPNYTNKVILTASRSNGKITIDSDINPEIKNKLLLFLSSEDTKKFSSNINQLNLNNTLSNMRSGTYYRDIRFIKNNEVITLLNGKLIVINNITNV